jgi:alkylation response protein AidB-like acyl-CoA dehydrogenase
MTGRMHLTEILERVDELIDVVFAHAEQAERDARLPRAVVDALIERGLLRLWVPRSLGGPELGLPESLAVFEAVSRLDGATGWTVMIGSGGGLFAPRMAEATARMIYGPREGVIAGSGSPRGVAVEEGDGYRVTGQWPFASGAHHATWFTANCLVQRDGEPVTDLAGQPTIRAMAFPAAEVTILETWTASGMRGTGSHDFAVDGVVVPRERSFSVFEPLPDGTGPLYRYPFMATSRLAFSAVALGVGQQALDRFAWFAAERRPGGGSAALSEYAQVRARYGEARATLRAGRSLLYETVASTWVLLEGGGALDAGDEAEVTLAAVQATRLAVRAVDLLYELAGSDPLYLESALGRSWRDVHAVAQHAALSPAAYEEAGGTLLDERTG